MITKDDWTVLICRLIGEVGGNLSRKEREAVTKFQVLSRAHIEKVSERVLAKPPKAN